MLIGYNRPDPISLTLVGTGAVVETSLSYLVDSKVAIPCRFTWLSGAQSIASVVNIQCAWSTAFVPRVAAILMPKTSYAIPANVKIQVLGATTPGTYTYNLLGNSQNQRTVKLPSGATACYFILPAGLSSIRGVSFNIYNDLNGSTFLSASQIVDVGEIWISGGIDFKINNTVQDSLIDPTTNRRSHSNQIWPLYRKPYDSFTVDFTPMTDTVAYDDTSTPSFSDIRYAISTADSAVVLPRYYTRGTTTIDTTGLHELACFGRPDSFQPLKGNGDRFWTAQMAFSEAPP